MLKTTRRIGSRVRKAVQRRDANCCILCRDNRGLHLHHFIPRGRGGQDCESNLVLLCSPCHRVAHGEYEYSRDFPFDSATAEDAIEWYLRLHYGEGG